ncbi:FlgD immunoglobulin-like domain containing protein [Candidatus Latescibacterota bacterium]
MTILSPGGGFKAIAVGLSVLDMESGEYYELIPPSENLSITPLCMNPDGSTLYAYVTDKYLGHTFFIGEDREEHHPRYMWIVEIPFDPDALGQPLVTSVEDGTPVAFPTITSYPNPFNPSTTISFTLPEHGFTELVVYNMAGQNIRTLVVGELTPGAHEVVWDGCDDSGHPVSSGMFVSLLKTGDTVVTNRMTLVK